MGNSLREQLLQAGFAPTRKEPPRAQEQRGRREDAAQARAQNSRPPQRKRNDEIDLARAYAMRAQTEKSERDAAQREAQKQAQERRERKRRLHEVLQGQALNLVEAEQVRHFEHAGKIRRIHVSAEQLASLNRGELGVVVQAGRFVLVARDVALRAAEIAQDSIALLVNPDTAPSAREDDVPDDLMW